jgi:hypothetical protein
LARGAARLLAVAVLGVLGACAALPTASDARTGAMAVHGLLVAPAGAVPGANAQAVVELRDATLPEGPVLAEARQAWSSSGTVPFIVVLPAEQFATVRSLRLRAAVVSGGRVSWLSEPRELPARAGRVGVGELALAPVSLDAFATALQCGELRIVIGYTQDAMRLRIAGDAGRLMQPTAGGTRILESAAEPGTRLELDRDTARLTWGGRTWPECVKVPLTDADARVVR